MIFRMAEESSEPPSEEASRGQRPAELPVFPFVPDAITRGTFRVIEPGDLRTSADVERLMRLMWDDRESEFYYYVPMSGPGSTGSAAMTSASYCGALLMNDMKRRFYRHPRYPRDYVEIADPRGSYRWPWQKEVVERGPEFWQIRLKLSARKIAELDAMCKIELEQKHLRKEPPSRKIARAVQPVHFEDFDGHQFERLVFAYHLRTSKWRSLEWYGQTGSDLGRDIWGEHETGETLCVQCVNRKEITSTKVTRDLDKIVRARGGAPDRVLVVCASAVSAALRDKVKDHAEKKGVAHCDIWSGQEFEERLRADAENLLRRFIQGETFPEDPEELRRFTKPAAAGDDAVVERIIQVFDRPAFHTPFQQESSLPAFRQAMADTIQALNTGIWQTRDGKEIARMPSRHELASQRLRDELAGVVRDLTELRARFDQLIRDGEIRPCECAKPDCPVFDFSSRAVSEMDVLRSALLARVHRLRGAEPSTPTPAHTVNVTGSNNSGIIANQVTIRGGGGRPRAIILPGSIAADATKYNYVEYLIKRLTQFREAGRSYGQRRGGRVHPGATRKILEQDLGGLPKDLPVERFAEVVGYLQCKIDNTALGRTNRKQRISNYHTFENHPGS